MHQESKLILMSIEICFKLFYQNSTNQICIKPLDNAHFFKKKYSLYIEPTQEVVMQDLMTN